MGMAVLWFHVARQIILNVWLRSRTAAEIDFFLYIYYNCSTNKNHLNSRTLTDICKLTVPYVYCVATLPFNSTILHFFNFPFHFNILLNTSISSTEPKWSLEHPISTAIGINGFLNIRACNIFYLRNISSIFIF